MGKMYALSLARYAMCATAQFPSTHFISPPGKRRKTFGGGAVVVATAWTLSSNFLVSSTAAAEVVVDTLAASMMMLKYVWLCSDQWIFGLVGDVHLLFAWRLNTWFAFSTPGKRCGFAFRGRKRSIFYFHSLLYLLAVTDKCRKSFYVACRSTGRSHIILPTVSGEGSKFHMKSPRFEPLTPTKRSTPGFLTSQLATSFG